MQLVCLMLPYFACVRPACLSISAHISTEIGWQYRPMPVFSRKYRNRDMNKCEFVPSETNPRALMGSYCSLAFAYFKSFPLLKYAACPDWSKKFVKPMNINFASKLSRCWPSSDMAGLNPKLLVISDCTKPTKRRKNARNHWNKLWPGNNRSGKDVSASAKAAHTVHCFWRKCSEVFDRERLSQIKQNKVVRV